MGEDRDIHRERLVLGFEYLLLEGNAGMEKTMTTILGLRCREDSCFQPLLTSDKVKGTYHLNSNYVWGLG